MAKVVSGILRALATQPGLAAYHQLTARRSSPAARGIVQLLILVASLAIFAFAIRL